MMGLAYLVDTDWVVHWPAMNKSKNGSRSWRDKGSGFRAVSLA
jgi:hypothetical protein